MLEHVNSDGKVISIDYFDEHWNNTLKSGKAPANLLEKIIFIQGDSTSETVVNRVLENIMPGPVIVILDSAHNRSHVLKELILYSSMVTINSYIIVNDTSWDLTPFRSKGSGPYAAVKEFISNNQDFKIDESLPRHFISSSPMGFLRRLY
jgi:cephalosporin hydroxylase